MKTEKLTQKDLLDIFDYKDGMLYWKKTRASNAKKGMRAGCVYTSEGYRRIKINRKGYLEHHIVWCFFRGEWPQEKAEIDHINRDPADNRIENLRLVNQKTNSQNRIGKGYSKMSNGKYQARIIVDKHFVNLGVYETPEEAGQKYLEAKAKYHKDCFIAT
jgi:hypothetical protein